MEEKNNNNQKEENFEVKRSVPLGDYEDESEEEGESNNSHNIVVKESYLMIQMGNIEIYALKGKDVILIIGKTGVGKTSFLQMIHGANFTRATGERFYEPVDIQQLLPDFEIGNAERSKTKLIRSYSCIIDGKELVFCDMPGYKDTDSYNIDIATSVWINQIAKVCNSLRFVIMIHGATLEEDRGEPFRDLMNLMNKLMKNDPQNIGKGMLILFTHMSDQFPEEREEEKVLSYINDKITNIMKAKKQECNILMKILLTFIKQKTGHLRVLNPVTTNIDELRCFIRHEVIPRDNAEQFIQCSFSREIGLAVSQVSDHLETTIRSALISKDIENQQNIYELTNLYLIFASMLNTQALKNSALRLIEDILDKYIQCKASVLEIVDSTVRDNVEKKNISNEEVQQIIPDYHKLKFLIQVLQEVINGNWINSLQEESHKKFIENFDLDDLLNINLEFHKKCLLMKIDILGKFSSSLDYSPIFQQLQSLQAIESLGEIIGK